MGQVRTCCKEQPGVNVTTADRLSSEIKRGAAVGSKPRLSRTDRQPKHNLRCRGRQDRASSTRSTTTTSPAAR